MDFEKIKNIGKQVQVLESTIKTCADWRAQEQKEFEALKQLIDCPQGQSNRVVVLARARTAIADYLIEHKLKGPEIT